MTDPTPRLVDVDTVAEMLAISPRSVYRMSDAGRMPRPLRLGRAVRWDRRAITEWIDGGCRHIGEVAR